VELGENLDSGQGIMLVSISQPDQNIWEISRLQTQDNQLNWITTSLQNMHSMKFTMQTNCQLWSVGN